MRDLFFVVHTRSPKELILLLKCAYKEPKRTHITFKMCLFSGDCSDSRVFFGHDYYSPNQLARHEFFGSCYELCWSESLFERDESKLKKIVILLWDTVGMIDCKCAIPFRHFG